MCVRVPTVSSSDAHKHDTYHAADTFDDLRVDLKSPDRLSLKPRSIGTVYQRKPVHVHVKSTQTRVVKPRVNDGVLSSYTRLWRRYDATI